MAKYPIKTEQKRRRKLGDKYIEEIISLAEKKYSSNTSVPQSRGYTTASIEKRIITDTGAKNSINLNKYNYT